MHGQLNEDLDSLERSLRYPTTEKIQIIQVNMMRILKQGHLKHAFGVRWDVHDADESKV